MKWFISTKNTKYCSVTIDLQSGIWVLSTTHALSYIMST